MDGLGTTQYSYPILSLPRGLFQVECAMVRTVGWSLGKQEQNDLMGMLFYAVSEGCSKLFKERSQLLTSKTVESNSPTKSIEIPSTDDVFSEAGDDVSTGRGAPHRAGAGV